MVESIKKVGGEKEIQKINMLTLNTLATIISIGIAELPRQRRTAPLKRSGIRILTKARDLGAFKAAHGKITSPFYFVNMQEKDEVVVVDSYPEPGGCNNLSKKFGAMTAVQ
ncbi:MAG: hypothetical protein GX107_07795 [Clostridiales bacterium]|jgi:hypothetical protein|nr:hypothetical protein [Clostridiales bacterium]